MYSSKAELLNSLIKKGKENGYILSNELIPLLNDESIDFEQVLVRLEKHKIEIVDEECNDNTIDNENYYEEDEEASNYNNESSRSISSLTRYIKEIGQFELLDEKEEKELSKTIQDGKQAEEKLQLINNDSNGYLKEDIEKLEYDVECKNQARETLINSNLRLVVNIARRYEGLGLPLEELIQEGNVGLVDAADNYNYDKGVRFSTYATTCIKRAIVRGLNERGCAIRLPGNVISEIRKIKVAEKELTNELGRTPTLDELAKVLEISSSQIEETLNYSQSIVSLDTNVGDDESTLGDFISDEDLLNPLDYTIDEKYRKEIDSILKTLDPIEEKVIRAKFNFDGSKDFDNDLYVSGENIRKIEMRALLKLHNPEIMKKLKKYR